MSHYFEGRKQVGEPFEVGMSGRRKLRCTIYQRWAEKDHYECHCGLTLPVKITKTQGITKTDSESFESSVSSKIGVKDVAELSSKIKAVSGHEVQWSYSKAEEMSFTCDAPQCGCKVVSVSQLVQEYELILYVRGYLFKRNVWDMEWSRTISQELPFYSATQDVQEYDERCKDCVVKPSPEFDGRLSLDLGVLSLRVPYKMTKEQLDVRVGKFGLRFPVENYVEAMMAFSSRTGVAFTLETRFVDRTLCYLSGLKETHAKGSARIYKTSGMRSQAEELAKEITLQNYVLEKMAPKQADEGLTAT